MSLRIAMVGACPYPVPQGSQVFLRANAAALRGRGHEVHVVVYGYGIGEDDSGLPLHRCVRLPGASPTKAGPHLTKPLLDLALVFTLRRVVREEKIDVVFAHNYEALLVALAAGKRPIIYHAHNAMSDELPYYFSWKKAAASFGRWLDRTFPRRADRVCVPHRRLAGHLIVRGCPHDKVAIVPPPLDPSVFEAAPQAEGIPPVLYAGNLDTYQNMDLLFAAMRRLRKDLPEAVLRIGTAEQGVSDEAELCYTPDFEHLRVFLGQGGVFAAPRVSWSGYPIKLLNAMAAGLPVVACESAAYPVENGVTGLVVPDNDTEAFAAALHRLLTDARLRTELGRKGRQAIEKTYRPEMVAEQLEGIAEALLGHDAEAPDG